MLISNSTLGQITTKKYQLLTKSHFKELNLCIISDSWTATFYSSAYQSLFSISSQLGRRLPHREAEAQRAGHATQTKYTTLELENLH